MIDANIWYVSTFAKHGHVDEHNCKTKKDKRVDISRCSHLVSSTPEKVNGIPALSKKACKKNKILQEY